ncbi:hypothetical protein STA1M1_19870 [Sinisalibacter aestuarii]|uniref:DUF1738 domain-containing protein n=1 Tax=Sinisalibacter aestuarii TaxID=2949426 RepID=A0ABQ5LT20_9RHOB|nr:hypothetical protein STA1M1_19870 [Sinisalibacter aestuarii]
MARSKPRFDAAASITNELIEIIDRGVLPWRKPWTVGGSSVPLRQNGEPYQGINNFLLTMRTMMAGYTSPYWMTLRQANELKAKVIKGSKSSVVVYYGTTERDQKAAGDEDKADTDDTKAIPFMKSYRVFNADQIEGLDARFHPEPPDTQEYPERAPIPHMQAFFEAIGATVSFSGREACYVPALDKIYLPPTEVFENPLNFYAVCRRHYAYYRCETRGCEAKSKSIPRAKMENAFAEIMEGLQPARGLFELAKAMLRDAWEMKLTVAHGEKDELQSQLKDVERQIESLLDRIVDATSASVVSAYEARIEKLERQKIVLAERIEKSLPPKGRLEDCIELALRFLSNPWNLYKNGDFTMRQTVLRLVFAEPLKYDQNGVYGTPELSFPFRYLEGFSGSKSEMVPQGRIELPTSPLPRVRSTTELLRRTVGG